METIRNEFVNEITQTSVYAVGSSVVLQLGIHTHLHQFATTYPDALIQMGAGHPDSKDTRVIQLAPTHQQIQNFLTNNRNILFELYLTEMIQHWFDFLRNIYKKAIEVNLSGDFKYKIPKAKIRVDLTLNNSDLNRSLIESACEYFDFLPAKEKLKKVMNIFGEKISLEPRDIDTLNANIQIRNILQHRKGIVGQSDLDDLGASSIEEDHGNSKKRVIVGQKITRTGYDLENLAKSLINISKTLVP